MLLSVSFVFRRRSITLMGPLWFLSSQNHGRNRGIEHFKWNLLLNVEYHSIKRYLTGILFLGKTGTPLSGENIPGGVATAWDHSCVASQTLPPPYPNSASMSKPEKKLQRSLFAPPKKRDAQFPNDLTHQVICCTSNSVKTLSIERYVQRPLLVWA